MGPNLNPNLLHSKRNHKQNKTKKTTLRMRKIFSNDVTKKGLISKIYKQLMQLNINNKTKNNTNGQKTETDISPRRYTMAKKHMKRCSTLLINRKMQNKTTAIYHTSQNGHNKKV